MPASAASKGPRGHKKINLPPANGLGAQHNQLPAQGSASACFQICFHWSAGCACHLSETRERCCLFLFARCLSERHVGVAHLARAILQTLIPWDHRPCWQSAVSSGRMRTCPSSCLWTLRDSCWHCPHDLSDLQLLVRPCHRLLQSPHQCQHLPQTQLASGPAVQSHTSAPSFQASDMTHTRTSCLSPGPSSCACPAREARGRPFMQACRLALEPHDMSSAGYAVALYQLQIVA